MSRLLLTGLLALGAPELVRAEADGDSGLRPAVEGAAPAAEEPRAAEPEIERVAYTVEIAGEMEGWLRTLLRRSSELVALEDRPPPSLIGLERRATGDLERLRATLRSEGFYEGALTYRIDDQATPAKVTIDVEVGPAYRLSRYDVVYRGLEGEAPLVDDARELGIEIGARARAPEIVAGQQRLIRLLTERGYPFARVADRRAVIDRGEDTLAVTVTVDPGARVGLGPLAIDGLAGVDESYVRGLRPWREGEPFDQRQLEAYRKTLAGTRLFRTVTITHAAAPSADGNVPVTLTLTERPHRSIGGGAAYSTSEGFAGSAFWEHRNLLGRDEDLRLELRAGEIEQRVSAAFGKPRFWRDDQTLLVDVALKREDTDAFEQVSLSSAVALERTLSDTWRGSLGVSAELAEITEDGDTQQFLLLGLPASAVRDTRDSFLNPTEGTRLELSLTPFGGSFEDALAFLVARVGAFAYWAADDEGRVVLAGRARAGSILGEDRDDIPASKRFYAGGGGSVRGYEFQKVGPLDADGDPVGGLSIVELSAELRLRVTQSIGVVPFIDGGAVWEDPDFTGGVGTDPRWAAGLGLRYFTPIGPVRLDVAFPLNKRKNIDDDFQFYISIGQAF